MSSGSLFSSSFSQGNDQYKDVYHKKVLTEKRLKNHGSSSDEFEWLYSKNSSIIWSNHSGVTWGSWSSHSGVTVSSYDYIIGVDVAVDTKPHLLLSEPARKTINKNPPSLTKKFGHYSNLSKRNAGFSRSKGFSRKSF